MNSLIISLLVGGGYPEGIYINNIHICMQSAYMTNNTEETKRHLLSLMGNWMPEKSSNAKHGGKSSSILKLIHLDIYPKWGPNWGLLKTIHPNLFHWPRNKKVTIALLKWMVGRWSFLLGWPIFGSKLLVLGSVPRLSLHKKILSKKIPRLFPPKRMVGLTKITFPGKPSVPIF